MSAVGEFGQFAGMPCYHDYTLWESAEVAAFGAPVQMRTVAPHGMIELCIGGVWYPCSLSELDAVSPDAWVDSIRAILERLEPA